MSSKTLINAHEIFDIIASRVEGWTAQELKAEAAKRFGEEVRYHTCSESDLTLRDLVEIAFDSGRLVQKENRIVTGRNGCTHK